MVDIRRNFKSFSRRLRRGAGRPIVIISLIVAAAAGIVIERSIVSVNYSQLLETIASRESRGNYNAYFGNASNAQIDFTAMTVEEVLAWQHDFVKNGSPSSAVGKYQFINTTLEGLVRELSIDPHSKFDADLQDRLAIHLLDRRGAKDYVRGRISREQLAYNLSQEWAALPRVIGENPETSYYAGDGLNKAHIRVDEFLLAIETLRQPKA